MQAQGASTRCCQHCQQGALPHRSQPPRYPLRSQCIVQYLPFDSKFWHPRNPSEWVIVPSLFATYFKLLMSPPICRSCFIPLTAFFNLVEFLRPWGFCAVIDGSLHSFRISSSFGVLSMFSLFCTSALLDVSWWSRSWAVRLQIGALCLVMLVLLSRFCACCSTNEVFDILYGVLCTFILSETS